MTEDHSVHDLRTDQSEPLSWVGATSTADIERKLSDLREED